MSKLKNYKFNSLRYFFFLAFFLLSCSKKEQYISEQGLSFPENIKQDITILKIYDIGYFDNGIPWSFKTDTFCVLNVNINDNNFKNVIPFNKKMKGYEWEKGNDKSKKFSDLGINWKNDNWYCIRNFYLNGKRSVLFFLVKKNGEFENHIEPIVLSPI